MLFEARQERRLAFTALLPYVEGGGAQPSGIKIVDAVEFQQIEEARDG